MQCSEKGLEISGQGEAESLLGLRDGEVWQIQWINLKERETNLARQLKEVNKESLRKGTISGGETLV